ncbi:acetyl-CoA synthetase [Methylopila jiangsuensis]|uniref:Acetyl-CoA synthetase n=1 Tax=Methylopila jiangsuensis TaxID=586230 RepID=A0A9W6JEQ5_9HYPH|nr:class I adenylate-forming enzyme family protein [Methylopila jiangsuensis]MDR6285310.1 acyl-CoA synthetase (AMP-forming)/AMP-acid ligase II [Methylopila jiangsuensis]GLK75066.1 acetyl-CoA synthetase [Methylopila jiangsuensis]
MSDVSNLGAVLALSPDAAAPAAVGVGLDGSGTPLSRADLAARAAAFARGLGRHGVARGDRIAILAANGTDYLAILLGAMQAGVVPVPVNWRFPAATIARIVADSGAKTVFHDSERRALAPDAVPTVEIETELGLWLDPGPFEPISPEPDEAALMLFTSGSTGRPKGVRLSHASHLWVARTRMADDALEGERLLIAAPLYHMNALALALLALASGATALLLPQFQARAYILAIDRQRATWLTAVPPMIAMMLREKEALATADLSSVKVVRMGSAPVNDALGAQIRRLLPNARIINAYGTTEGGPLAFVDPDGAAPTGSVGRPHPGVTVRLAGEGAPDLGVLQVKSPALMLGYHERPDVRSPITADGFYDTGDVFRRDGDGFYAFVGRTDDMFVSGGENIFPGDVEAMLETHPDVAQAVVVPVDDDIKGQKPVAFVVKRPGSALDEAALKAYALAHAPAYQHPRRVWFVDQIPLASTNKIDRAALTARARTDLSPA